MKIKRLKRVAQCSKCPWKVSTNPHDIPGYCEAKHGTLEGTIADGFNMGKPLRVMSCHEEDGTGNDYCVGWLFHQLGPGNNISLRMRMLDYDLSKVKLIGEQHETFEDTLP